MPNVSNVRSDILRIDDRFARVDISEYTAAILIETQCARGQAR